MRRTVLHYLKRPDSTRAQGSIPLHGKLHLATDVASYPQPFCFQLVTPGRAYALQAPSKAAMVHWMAALTAALEDLRAEERAAAAAEAEAAAKKEAEERAAAEEAAAKARKEAAEAAAKEAAEAARKTREAAAAAKAAAEKAAADAEAAKYPTPGSPAAAAAEAATRAHTMAAARGALPVTPTGRGGGGPVELTDDQREQWARAELPEGVNVVVREQYGNRSGGSGRGGGGGRGRAGATARGGGRGRRRGSSDAGSRGASGVRGSTNGGNRRSSRHHVDVPASVTGHTKSVA